MWVSAAWIKPPPPPSTPPGLPRAVGFPPAWKGEKPTEGGRSRQVGALCRCAYGHRDPDEPENGGGGEGGEKGRSEAAVDGMRPVPCPAPAWTFSIAGPEPPQLEK